MHLLFIVVGTAMLVTTAALNCASLRVHGLAWFLIAALTIGAAELVFLSVGLSVFDAYRPVPMLLGQLALLLIELAAWIALGRPGPEIALPSLGNIWSAARVHGAVSVMTTAALLAVLVDGVLAIAVAPNNWDSMMYHLSRVAFWIQNESVFNITGGTLFENQHQPNAEVIYGWTLLIFDGDRFAALVAWLALIGCGAVVYTAARMLQFARPASLFAAAVFMTLPQVVLQGSSTMTDLTGAFLVGAFALFVVRAISTQSVGDIALAALALGVGVAVKGTVFIAGPGLLMIIIASLRYWRPSRPALLIGTAILAAGMLALGSWKYIENTLDTGSPTGPAGRQELRIHASLIESTAKTVWAFADLPGFGGSWPAQVLAEGHARVWLGEGIFPDTAVTEDGTGYGPIVPLVLLPLLASFALRRSEARSRRILAVAAGSFFVIYVIVLEPDPFAGRTLIAGVLLGAPLLARVQEVPWLRYVVTFVALIFLFPVLFQNQKKPLWPNSVLGLDRATQQAQGHVFAPALQHADRLLPPDARLAYIGPAYGTWDYPFFGPHLDRYLVRVEVDPGAGPSGRSVTELIQREDLDAVVWAGIKPPDRFFTTNIGEIAFSQHAIHLVGNR